MTNDLATSRRAAVDAFLERNRQVVAAGSGRARLVFAIDATASRQRTWDLACKLQGDMFQEVAMIGGLDVQLVFYRACECKTSRWVSDGRALAGLMEKIDCESGHTQLAKVLDHSRQENARQKVAAMVFVGDCVEEQPADLYAAARGLSLPAFLFQEGDDPMATKVFHEIARLTGGAHCRFDPGSTRRLGELLRAVATYATGGLAALGKLRAQGTEGAGELLQQLK